MEERSSRRPLTPAERQRRNRRIRLQRQRRVRRMIIMSAVAFLLLIVLIFLVAGKIKKAGNKEKPVESSSVQVTLPVPSESEAPIVVETESVSETAADPAYGTVSNQVYQASADGSTASLPGEVVSERAILVDVNQDRIIASRGSGERMNPASMTKVLTVLVAAEHLKNLDDTFTINTEITDFSYRNDCSNVGFADGETVTIRDLFYGTILPSGADAALGLAIYTAGSQEAFVELMNQKLDSLGLSGTAHFTNCVGLYDDNHYCTVYDMAMILEAAMDNELCKEVLSAHTYTTSSTAEHPEGIEISNWFLRRIEDKDSGGTVVAGKTGYVVQSGNCAVSYATDSTGASYVCATSNSTSGWRCIYDHVAIYKQFLK